MGVLGRATCLQSGEFSAEGEGGKEGCPPANLSINQGKSCPGFGEVKAGRCLVALIALIHLPKAGVVDIVSGAGAMRCVSPLGSISRRVVPDRGRRRGTVEVSTPEPVPCAGACMWRA